MLKLNLKKSLRKKKKNYVCRKAHQFMNRIYLKKEEVSTTDTI